MIIIGNNTIINAEFDGLVIISNKKRNFICLLYIWMNIACMLIKGNVIVTTDYVVTEKFVTYAYVEQSHFLVCIKC